MLTEFDAFFTAMKAGAASVYHEIIALQDDVTKWESDNPEVMALVNEGVTLANAFLTAHGIPVQPIELGISALFSEIKAMAAADPTVGSGATNAGQNALIVAEKD